MSIDPEIIAFGDVQPETNGSLSADNDSGLVYCTPQSAGKKVLQCDVRSKQVREIGPPLRAGYWEPVKGSNGAFYAVHNVCPSNPFFERVLEIRSTVSVDSDHVNHKSYT